MVFRTAPILPEAIVPENFFLNIAQLLRHKINKAYAIFRSLASGRDVKKFLKVRLSQIHLRNLNCSNTVTFLFMTGFLWF